MKLKISLLIGVILLLSNFSFSQINTMRILSEKEVPSVGKYDSTSNFLYADCKKYIGQVVYLVGQTDRLKKYGYNNFYSNAKTTKIYHPSREMLGSSSDYNALAEKYYQVSNVYYSKEPKSAPSEHDHDYIFELIEKNSGDKIYYRYNQALISSFPFIVVGFFEKQKSIYIGKTYQLSPEETKKNLDYETGKPIKTDLTINWKCVDLIIDEEYYILSMLLESENHQKTLMNFEYMKLHHN